MKNKEAAKKASTENAEWLVNTARSYELNGEVCTAKSWLLTAKSLFPRDFSIQVCSQLLVALIQHAAFSLV